MSRLNRRYRWAWVALVLLLIVSAALVYVAWPNSARPIRIAVLGPMSGDYAGSGRAMAAATRLQAQQINETGGVHGRPLVIKTFDSRADPERAAKLAREIADSDVAAVVGAYFSSVAVKAAPIFKQRHVPAITGSATAPRLVSNNPWYFRVVPDNNSKGRFSALYTDGVLDQKRVDIVFERDAYGQTLNRAYAQKARELGVTINHRWAIDSAKPNTGDKLDAIVKTIQQEPQSGAIYVALLGRDAARLIAKLHAAHVDRTIIGGDAVGLSSFRDAFKSLEQSPASIVDASNGVYATTYFLPDIANQKAQAFIAAFRQRYKREPQAVAAPNYDAVGLIASALQAGGVDGPVKRVRSKLRRQLSQYGSLERAYQGVTGNLFFNQDGGVIKPATFGVYSQGRLISAGVQLTPVVHPQSVPNLDRLKQRQAAVTMNGHDYYKTNIVYTGVDIKHLDQIDTQQSTFDADFYLWFRFSSNTNFDPDEILFGHATEPVDLGSPVAQHSGNGQRYVAFRVDATFDADFDFHAFPFDTQALKIDLRPKLTRSNRLKLVADEIGMQGQADSRPSALTRSNAWRLRDLRIFSDTDTTESTLGNPALLGSGTKPHISYSRLNVVAHVHRLARSYVLSNLAPLFFVLLLGYAMLFVPVEGPPFTARINLGVLALLTTVSFSLKTSKELPDISYLVLLDYLYFAVYCLLLYGIATSILKLHWVKQGYVTRVHRLERTSRFLMPALFAIAVAALLLLSLR